MEKNSKNEKRVSMYVCMCGYRYFVCATNSVLDKWEYLRVFPMVSDDINELGVFPVKFYYVLKKEL